MVNLIFKGTSHNVDYYTEIQYVPMIQKMLHA